MTDTNALRAAIKGRGLKFKYVAEHLNLTPQGFSKKMNNVTEFKAGEIEKLAGLLELNWEDQYLIFFKRGVDE